MAVTSGTVHTVNTVDGHGWQDLQVALVLFTMSGTYAQADNSILSGVPTLIQESRRNGKTVTMRGVMIGQAARKESAPGTILAVKTVAISSSNVTFEVTDGDYSTEHADATAIPAQSTPFGILVAFTEA
jgi:co-chaperonin GroES (HSP10)